MESLLPAAHPPPIQPACSKSEEIDTERDRQTDRRRDSDREKERERERERERELAGVVFPRGKHEHILARGLIQTNR